MPNYKSHIIKTALVPHNKTYENKKIRRIVNHCEQ